MNTYLFRVAVLFLVICGCLAMSGCTMSMEYNRAMEIKAVNAAYSSGQFDEYQRDQKIAGIRHKYTEYEAQMFAHLKAEQNQMPMSSQSQGYSYTPQPQMTYVYNQDPGPRQTYIPPPQTYTYNQNPGPRATFVPAPQTYNYNQDPGPRATFIPAPQTYTYNQDPAPKQTFVPPPQKYVYNERPAARQEEYKPESSPTYVYNKQSTKRQVEYTPPPERKYVYRKDMTPAQQEKFDALTPKPLQVGVNPHDTYEVKLKEEQDGYNRAFGEKYGPVIHSGVTNVAATGIGLKTPGGAIVDKVEPLSKLPVKNGVIKGIYNWLKGEGGKEVDKVIDSAPGTSQKK